LLLLFHCLLALKGPARVQSKLNQLDGNSCCTYPPATSSIAALALEPLAGAPCDARTARRRVYAVGKGTPVPPNNSSSSD